VGCYPVRGIPLKLRPMVTVRYKSDAHYSVIIITIIVIEWSPGAVAVVIEDW